MVLKKAAAFSLVLATTSVGTLIIMSHKTVTSSGNKGQLPAPVKCSSQYKGNNAPLPWNIVTANFFPLEV